jgi:hypothetical protein
VLPLPTNELELFLLSLNPDPKILCAGVGVGSELLLWSLDVLVWLNGDDTADPGRDI